MNPFPYSDDNKRYHTLAYHNRHTYGKRIWKAVLDGGFSCPNLDGTCGTGGCVFCDGGSGYFTHAAAMPIPEQLEAELARIRKRDPAAKDVYMKEPCPRWNLRIGQEHMSWHQSWIWERCAVSYLIVPL